MSDQLHKETYQSLKFWNNAVDKNSLFKINLSLLLHPIRISPLYDKISFKEMENLNTTIKPPQNITLDKFLNKNSKYYYLPINNHNLIFIQSATNDNQILVMHTKDSNKNLVGLRYIDLDNSTKNIKKENIKNQTNITKTTTKKKIIFVVH